MSLIFLVGMPGAGKTHWGRLWSEAHSIAFIDLDEQLTAKAGLAIVDIFKSIGEPGFRKLEAAVLLETIVNARGSDAIIAVGGGTPAFGSNMDSMLRTGCVVYLRAEISTLLRQIKGADIIRPLLQIEGEGRPTLENLLEQRQPFYERATFTHDVEQLRTNTFAQILQECTSRQS